MQTFHRGQGKRHTCEPFARKYSPAANSFFTSAYIICLHKLRRLLIHYAMLSVDGTFMDTHTPGIGINII